MRVLKKTDIIELGDYNMEAIWDMSHIEFVSVSVLREIIKDLIDNHMTDRNWLAEEDLRKAFGVLDEKRS